MQGHFEGVKTHPEVTEPYFESTGNYKTVRHGWLHYFVLLVPVGAKIKKLRHGTNSSVYLVEWDGKKKAFLVFYGDAWTPGRGSLFHIREAEELEKRDKILAEAKAVF